MTEELPAGVREAAADDLHWRCAPLAPPRVRRGIVEELGQPGPLDALRTALGIHAHGFHVFVSGLDGPHRMQSVAELVRALAGDEPVEGAADRVVLHNFDVPQEPRLVTLPAGRGPEFRDDLAEVLGDLVEALRQAVTSPAHRGAVRRLGQAVDASERRSWQVFERIVVRRGLAVVEQGEGEDAGTDVLPVVDGEPVDLAGLDAAVRAGKVKAAARQRLLAARDELLEQFEELGDRVRVHRAGALRERRELERVLARRVASGLLESFRRRWRQPAVDDFVSALERRIARDPGLWLGEGEADGETDGEAPRADLREFEAVVLRSGPERGPLPVVVEASPSYANLFGVIDRGSGSGEGSDLGGMQGGALLRADGGVLVLRAADLFGEPGVWRALERALDAGAMELREFDPGSGVAGGAVRPEAIPLQVKVVLVGETSYDYERFCEADRGFGRLFKMHAAFETDARNDAAGRRRVVARLTALSEAESLPRFAADAGAAMIELAARLAGRRDRLSRRTGELDDVAREAAWLARRSGARSVTRGHVDGAVRARQERGARERIRWQAAVRDGYLRLVTRGRVVGEVNALTVVDCGEAEYGRVVRVTARSAASRPGRGELVQIDREAEMTGPIHDKGLLILQGYLLEALGRDRPPSFAATLCFEQSYEGLDGDSASAAELVALLSSLAGVPIRQDRAVTGAVDQQGRLQAVGAVSTKIDGFHRLCGTRARREAPGVVVPVANTRDLLLEPDQVAAVREGRFRIWMARDIAGVLELLTGRRATEVLQRARAQLDRWAERGGT